jgi:serine/threonine protein phosphatase PrpC
VTDWRDEQAACPTCGEPAFADDRWCEACGAPLLGTDGGPAIDGRTLAPPSITGAPSTGVTTVFPAGAVIPACPSCGAPDGEADVDGYCGRCGRRWAPVPEHYEVVDGPVAAVSDRGTTHWRNEDAVGLRWIAGDPGGFVMVVCDGVSLSQDPHLVSRAAVETALLVLSGAVSAGGDLDAAMVEAAAAAQRAAASVPYDPGHDLGPGACTFVATAVRGTRAAFASIGDSRAYWVDAAGALQIGSDDSLAAELVASGGYTARQAMATSGAHALTKWLGVDSTDTVPNVTSAELPGPGLVVLASDGLWNYAPEPADLAQLIGPVGAESPLDLARRLAAFAEASGGADNITVAVGPYGLDRLEVR